ncbi:MAG: pantetheine-phosphate adenylyltransferase [Opitutus sp.]|nr:pantetheine-phosphate adenylyltransferase [Opitutus sp.]
MRHCIYPGTFDPITYGHLDVLARAAKLFDRVTVAIAENAGKGPLFSAAERLALVQGQAAKFPNVTVVTFGNLLVEFAQQHKADAIIRGLRAISDFEFEFNMALMNRHLDPRIETIFVMPAEQFSLHELHAREAGREVRRRRQPLRARGRGGSVAAEICAKQSHAVTRAIACYL